MVLDFMTLNLEDSGRMPSKFGGKNISNLEFYTQANKLSVKDEGKSKDIFRHARSP